MIKNSFKQTGSAHVIIIIILMSAIIGALGYVVWNNFIRQKDDNSVSDNIVQQAADTISKKSEIVSIKNSDMNKYINYEKGFEFQFPKQILTNSACREFNTRRDNYGNEYPSQRHYGGAAGVVDMTIFESEDDYIITPKTVVIQSSPAGSAEKGYIYTSCEIKETNLDVIASTKVGSYETNIFLEHQSFRVLDVKNEADVLGKVREIFKDNNANVEWLEDSLNNRKEGKYIPSREGPGFAYKIWYYPAQKKLVYVMIGHSEGFANPNNKGTNADKYYFPQLITTFKFI